MTSRSGAAGQRQPVDPRAPAATVYETRAGVFDGETQWRLTDTSLLRERQTPPLHPRARRIVEIAWRICFPFARSLTVDHWPDATPYEAISSIRTRFDPTRFDRSRERCDLTGPYGACVSIFSSRYVGPAHFEDQSSAYKTFVDELTSRVLAARAETPVFSGLTWSSYLVQLSLVGLLVFALAQALSIPGPAALEPLWVKSGLALGSAGLLAAYMRRNFPRKLHHSR